ncbi:hypothetical protein K502DRAFT_237228, partial [Neoconidiobolus thromboides FSU 785]
MKTVQTITSLVLLSIISGASVERRNFGIFNEFDVFKNIFGGHKEAPKYNDNKGKYGKNSYNRSTKNYNYSTIDNNHSTTVKSSTLVISPSSTPSPVTTPAHTGPASSSVASTKPGTPTTSVDSPGKS